MFTLDNRRTLQTIERALVEARQKVTLTNTWRDIHQFYGVGQAAGRWLLLGPDDRTTLRQLVIRHCNIDLLGEGGQAMQRMTGADRMALSQQIPNEKLSGTAVGSEMVLIGAATGTLHLPGGDITLHPGMLIYCHYSHLHGLDRIVLVENQAVMLSLTSYQWPASLGNAVMLFRGSPQFTPSAVTSAIQGVSQIVCFPDYDPQGLMNSLTQPGCTAIIMPSAEAIETLLGRGLNKIETYNDQEQARYWLKGRSDTFAPAAQILDRQIAIAQEAMPGCELALIPIASASEV